MKKHIRLLIVLVCAYCAVSCTPTQFAGMQKRRIVSDNEKERIIRREHPHLAKYFDDRVIYVSKLNEYTDSMGNVYYDFKYRFLTRYISDYEEQMQLLKLNFPEIYDLYKRGEVVLSAVRLYVKDESIRCGIAYHYR